MLIAYTVHLALPVIKENSHKHVLYQQQAVEKFQIQNNL